MSSQNGDKARFHKLRRKKLHRRELMAKMANRPAAKATPGRQASYTASLKLR